MKNVSMYTLSTCPWCRKTKKFFTDHDIPFQFTDFDLADEATQDKIIREMEAEGAKGFPFVRIDDQVIEGWQPARYAELLGIRADAR
jgi:glutaredoxin